MKEAVALAGGARRGLSAREEELLGLLAGFPDGECGSDRELSFSDLVEAGGARPITGPDADQDLGAGPAPREDRPCAAAAQSSPPRHEATAAAASKQQAARQRARRNGGSRGSFGGGGGGDGVLLNFYMPGLLTRSMTAPRPGRGPPSPGAAQAKPVTSPDGKASRRQAALGIGCWPALWGRSRRPAKACI